MDLALQLSQHEASVAALQLQRREEEDVMKAIQESVSTSRTTRILLIGHKHLFFSSEQSRDHVVLLFQTLMDVNVIYELLAKSCHWTWLTTQCFSSR